MSKTLDETLALVERIDDDDLREDLMDSIERLTLDLNVERAKRHLHETIDEFAYDATGQDGEREIDAAARDYCAAQDERMKHNDPDRWAEYTMTGEYAASIGGGSWDE